MTICGFYQEGADILSKLALGGWSAVIVLDNLVVERCAHADSATGEVGVEVLNGGQWWIKVDLNQKPPPKSSKQTHILKKRL